MKSYLMDYINFNFKLTTILLASFLTLLKHFVFEHIFDDIEFLIGITLLVVTDAVSGSYVAFLKGEFRLPYLFKKTIRKCAGYVLFIGGTSMLLKLKVGGEKANYVQFFDDYLYMGVALAEFWSIVQNIDVIVPGLAPKWLKKWLQESTENSHDIKPLKSILVFVVGIGLMSGCVTNRRILNEIRQYKSTQDSLLSTQHLFYRYEKAKIDSTIKAMPDDDLLREIDRITSPSPKSKY